MLRILNSVVFLTFAIQIEGKDYLRVVSGRDASPNEYPYVLSIQKEINITVSGKNLHGYIRICTGSLITATWVITAAHCFVDDKFQAEELRVRFGDMKVRLPEASQFYRRVLKLAPHPGYFPSTDYNVSPDDIALMQTEEVPVKPGRLSAIEYKTLIGLPVTYAGYGITKFNGSPLEDLMRPLQIGEGGIVPCDEVVNPNSVLCVVPKCINLGQYGNKGDSGGPLFYKDNIIGVFVLLYPNFIRKRAMYSQYTPVSPYLEWIYNVIHESK